MNADGAPLYPESFRQVVITLSDDGVLSVRLHTDGGSLVWGGDTAGELARLFRYIADDERLRVVILSGTGSDFCSRFDMASVDPGNRDRTPLGWDRTLHEGVNLMQLLLSIRVPVIGLVNGPARIHADIPLLCDIVLAAEEALFQDIAHVHSGMVAGDGVHVLWPMLLGPNRGRSFLFGAAEIDAAEALRLGMVAEVVAADQLLLRAHMIADYLLERPVLALRYTKELATRELRRRMTDELGYGLALEGLGAVELQGKRMNRD